MSRIEDRQFEQFQRTGEAGALAKAFDHTATELWRIAWYLSSGDAHRAEDALQSTFLTAIEERQSWDSSRPLRPWLLGILANHVRNDRRRAKRTSEAESTFASLSSDRQPIDAAAQAEVRARVSAAIQDLHNPYREVIALHIEHGLSATEIATALDRKPATTRTQLARGLEFLRKALPIGIATSATLTLPDAATAAQVLRRIRGEITARIPIVDASTTIIEVAPTAWKGYALIAGLLVLASATTYALSPGPEPSVHPTPTANLAPVDLGSTEIEDNPNERIPPRTVVETASRDPISETFTVEIHIVNSEGQPVPHAPLQTQRDQRMSFLSADANGVAVFAALESSPSPLEIAVVGRYASASIPLTDPPFFVKKQLVIIPGMHITVRVIDRFGRPVAGALVEGIFGHQWQRMHNPLGHTDAGGILEMLDVELDGQLRAYASGHQLAKFKNVAGQVGEEIDVTLTLGPQAVAVRGRVVYENGDPIADASLAIVQYVGRLAKKQYLQSDTEGRFRIDWLEPGRHLIIGEFWDEHDGYLGFTRFDHLDKGEPDVEVILLPGRHITGTISDESGEPISGATVAATYIAEGTSRLPFTSRTTTADADGAFILTSLLPGPTRCSAWTLGTHRSATIEVAQFGNTEWNPILTSPLPVRAILIDERGSPLVGWRAHQQTDEGYHMTMSMSDESGVVGEAPPEWKLLPGKTMRVALHAPLPKGVEGMLGNAHDYVPSFISDPIGPSATPHPIRVPDTARANRRAYGRILSNRNGTPRKAKIALVSDRSPKNYLTTHWSDRDTGRFTIAPLSPGRYELTIRVPGEPWFKHSFQVGVNGDLDLGDLSGPASGTVRVTARHADGSLTQSSERLTMRIVTKDGRSWNMTRQGDSSFVAENVYQGDVEIMVWGLCVPSRRHALQVSESSQIDLVLPKPIASTEIIIVLPEDQQRSDGSWTGTVRVLHADNQELILEQSLRHNFLGKFMHRLEFSLPLETGNYEIEVESWDKRNAQTNASIPGPAIVVALPKK